LSLKHSLLSTELVGDALRRAMENRRPNGKRLLHHSDRCCWMLDSYGSAEYFDLTGNLRGEVSSGRREP
jgi:hypothetical protein